MRSTSSTPYTPYTPVPPLPPVARAGMNQTVAVNTAVSFDGSDSTSPHGSSLKYSWDFDDDANPTARGCGEMPSHTYTTPGAKTVTLTVTDKATKLTDSDEVTINVKPLPVAEAGDDQIVGVNQKVCFDGSGSTGIGIDYLWDFGDDRDSTAIRDKRLASYTYTTKGDKMVSLTVTDRDTGLKHRDTVTITVRPPPVAEAGDNQTVAVNTAVSFDGSDSEGSDLSYSWVFGADATPATAISTTPQTSCTYSTTGARTVILTVMDTITKLNHSDVVTINVEPVAKAGSDQTVGVGDTVSFDGSGSIGTNLSYSWDFGADATPATGTGATPSCTYSAHGAKKVTLTVMNTVTKFTNSDEVIINVEPVARAGSDRIVVVDNTVSFDGSGSIGTNLSYSWDFGTDATPATGSGETPSCTYSMTGTKTVTLTVTQGEGDQSRSDTDTLTVTVTSNEPRGVNNIEREALIYTFGDEVGKELAGLIEIRFDEDVESASVPLVVDGDVNVSRIKFNPAYNDDSRFWLGIFIHEAAHIWQQNTKLYLEHGDRLYDYTLDQLQRLDLNREEHADAVRHWFVVNYAYTNGIIGEGPGKLLASAAWTGPLQPVLRIPPDFFDGMGEDDIAESDRIRVINFYYEGLINEIRDSTRLPFTDTEAGQNYPNPAD